MVSVCDRLLSLDGVYRVELFLLGNFVLIFARLIPVLSLFQKRSLFANLSVWTNYIWSSVLHSYDLIWRQDLPNIKETFLCSVFYSCVCDLVGNQISRFFLIQFSDEPRGYTL